MRFVIYISYFIKYSCKYMFRPYSYMFFMVMVIVKYSLGNLFLFFFL